MNFTNVSEKTNQRLTTEVDAAISSKRYNKRIIAALLAATAEVDPLAGPYATMDTAIGTEMRAAAVTCSFLKGTEKTEANSTAEERKLYPPFGAVLDGTDPSTLFVLQSEYGVIVPPIPATATSSSSSSSTSGAEGKKKAEAYIGSPDATSCLILGARAYLKGAPQYVSATAIGHFDREGPQLIEGVRGMYFKSLLPAIGDQIRVFSEAAAAGTLLVISEEGEGGSLEALKTIAAAPSKEVCVEWYFIGGMINDKYTLPCMSDLFTLFFRPMFAPASCAVAAALVGRSAGSGSGVFTVSHSLRPDGQCFWSLNTFKDRLGQHTCTIRGARINALDGSSEPFEMRANARGYPFAHVRGTRFASQSLEDSEIVAVCVRPGDGSRKLRHTEKEPRVPSHKSLNNGTVFEADFAAYLAAVREAIAGGAPIPIIVPPQLFEDVPAHYVTVTSEQAARMSTTPHCEPIDFAPRLAANFHYAAQATTGGVFGQPPLAIANWKPAAKQ